jgi:hypothetical protein
MLFLKNRVHVGEFHNMNIHSAGAFCTIEGKGKDFPVLN